MTSYESMKSKLLPLGIYSFESGGVADSELKAYACGLDPVFDMLGEMEREGFTVTAESYGLSEREQFIQYSGAELATEERRQRLVNAERNETPTPEGFRQMLRCCGAGSFSVTESPANNRVTVTIFGTTSDSERALLRKRISLISPPELNVTVLF